MSLARRLEKLEKVRTAKEKETAEAWRFLSREELCVRLIHSFQKDYAESKGRPPTPGRPPPRTPEEIEYRNKVVAGYKRAFETVEALKASGRYPQILAALRAKGLLK